MAKTKVRRVRWEWEEWLEQSYFTPQELYLFCVAEANEKYREGDESPVSDSEYDYLCTASKSHEITAFVGTGLTTGLVLFCLGHTEEYTYMKQTPRRAPSQPAPKPTPPATFESLINDYSAFKKEHFGGDLPKELPYNQHRVKNIRAWDSDQKQLDYDVKVVDGKILIPAAEDDNVSEWAPEETANIAGKYYFAMQLDGYFVLMDDAAITDKTGELLYEGDIVEDSAKKTFVVVFDRHWCRWVLSTTHAIDWTPATLSISINYAVATTRIGNIYQNIELMRPT